MERFWVFIIPLVLLILAESAWPKRGRQLSRRVRWPGAILLLAVGTLLLRLIVPAGLIGVSLWAEAAGFGLFQIVSAPIWIAAIAGYLVFDFAVWAQHVALHKLDFLWRFHRVHHADPEIDVITALRFHPGELLISLLWKGAIVALFGLPAWCILWYEAILNIGAMFNHSNLALPKALDRVLRWGIVTPDMHRVHHSTDDTETNSNFGFFIPWWDRLFGVYRAQPARGHADLQIGQRAWRSREEQSIWALLIQPRFKP